MVKINVTDIPIEGAEVLTSSYELKIIGVDAALAESLDRLKPLPVQTGTLPEAKVTLDSFGKVTIDFNTEFSFPPDMVQKINNFTVPIVVGTN